MEHLQLLLDQPGHPPADAPAIPADQARFPPAADRYRTLLASLDVGYGLLELIDDADGTAVDWRILEVNLAFQRETGLTDTVGKTARDLNPATEPRWAAVLDTVARTGEAMRFEQQAAGLARWFEVHAARIGGDGSRTVAVVFTNITARKQAEAALRASEERLRLVVESVQDYAIFTIDPEGRVTSWNTGAQRLTGYPAEEILGHPSELLYTMEDRAAGTPAHERATAVRVGRSENEGWHVRKDGSRFWANEIMTPLYADDGTHLGFTKISRDLTTRQQAEAERERLLEHAEQARAAAEAALQVRDQFLWIAAHELRTPLHVALGYAELLQRAAQGTGAPHSIPAKIIQQIHRLNRQIDQLLDVSRLEHGQFVLERQRVDLVALATQVVDEVRTTVPSQPHYTLDLALPTEPVLVDGDAAWLEQVLHNLLSNAIKYSPAGGPIHVHLEHTSTEAVLEVTDAGIGIPADAQAHLFDLFYRAGNVDAQLRGFGLGLHIVKEIVIRHGGRIEVTSTEGAGATFRVVLPLHMSEHARAQGGTCHPA